MTAPVEKFEDLEYYEQHTGENILYQYVVKPGTLGLMSAGRVRLTGPTRKTEDVHETWDQIYIILKGSGTIIVGDQSYPVGPEHVVRVPTGTNHGVVMGDGEEMEYVYVNAYVNDEALLADED